MQDQRKIVIQMGVSQEHISECVSIVSQLLGNTVKPDLIFVNLSQKDFPKRMDSLPDDVVRMFMTVPSVKVVWDYGTQILDATQFNILDLGMDVEGYIRNDFIQSNMTVKVPKFLDMTMVCVFYDAVCNDLRRIATKKAV